MSETLIFSETKDKLTIKILSSMKPIVKVGLIFQGLLLTALGAWAGQCFTSLFSTDSSLAILLLFALCIVYFMAGLNYLKRVFNKEILEVTQKELTIIDKYLTSKQSKTFAISEISNIGFVGQHKYTRHPMDNNIIDFTGFGTSEKAVQYIIEDGTVEIFYNGSTIRFGKNLASWDAKEIISRIENFTGNNLHMEDKMEQLMDELDNQELKDENTIDNKSS